MPTPAGPFNLATTFLRLRSDSRVEPLPVNAEFWSKLMSGALGTFHQERLVTLLAFDKSWRNWEMHPNGDEIVCLLAGRVTIVLDVGGREREIELAEPGGYAIVPQGTWHTARTSEACRMLFITPGEGTEHRDA
jgi:mannose-6-phosphate isomerase-like protein (cupin superfamily)